MINVEKVNSESVLNWFRVYFGVYEFDGKMMDFVVENRKYIVFEFNVDNFLWIEIDENVLCRYFDGVEEEILFFDINKIIVDLCYEV